MSHAESWNAWGHVAHGWTVFALEGQDAQDWLQRQGTQDVRKLDKGSTCWNTFLNRRGEVECLFLMARADDTLLTLTPPGFRNAFEDRVERFVILEEVVFRRLYDEAPVVILAGSDVAATLVSAFSLSPEAVPLLTGGGPGPIVLGRQEVLLWPFTWGGLSGFFLFPSEPDVRHAEQLLEPLTKSGVAMLSQEEWQVLTDLAGYPLPQDTGVLLPETPWDLAALGENKGCYPGQEVVARLRAYGAVRRRLMALRWLEIRDTSVIGPGARLRLEGGAPAGRIFRHIHILEVLKPLSGMVSTPVTLCWMDKSCREPGMRLKVEEISTGSALGEAELADLPVWTLPDARKNAETAAEQARRWFEEDPEDIDPRPVKEMMHALLLNPDRSEYYETLTVVLIRRKRYTDALPVARAWVHRFPNEIMAHSNLSLVLANLGLIREAEAAKETARRLETERDLARRREATVTEEEFRRRARAEAEERAALFREALEYDPDDTVALMGLGVALQTLDRPEEAIPCFRRAVEIDPGYSVAWLRLGECLEVAGDLNGALEAWREGARVARQRGDMMPARAMEARARALSTSAGGTG